MKRSVTAKNICEVRMSDNLESIGYEAFSECKDLKSISLPDSLNKIGYGVFQSTAIETIDLPDGIEVINANTFEWCSDLRHVGLPKHLRSINWHAFHNCEKLSDITGITSTFCEIGMDAFTGCEELLDENGFIIVGNILTFYNGNERVLTIPEGVKSIGCNIQAY